MTDAPAPAPPKKRFGFKKAAWQTAAPKKEGAKDGEEESMFSHSADFRDIVAEEARRKAEERRKKKEAEEKAKSEKEEKMKKAREEEEKLRREVREEQERLRRKRKASSEMDGDLDTGRGGKGRSNTLSPEQKSPVDNLASRYEALTQTPSSSAVIIDLGDSDEDEDDDIHVPRLSRHILPNASSIPMRGAPRALSPEIEEGEDPELVEFRRRARAREAARKAEAASAALEEGNQSPVVQLLMTSEIPGTNPLMVKVRLDTTIEKPRDAWCSRQGFTPAQSRDIFCTFKMRKIYNTTKVVRLGLQDLGNGCVKMDGDETIYDEENLARPTVQMWNEELFKEYQTRQAQDAAMERKAAESVSVYKERTPEPEPEASNNIRLILKAKDKKPWKIVVRPDTTIEKLMTQYKNVREIPKEQPITLMFDDERLKPIDVVGDYDIEDGDSLDVYFK